MRRTAGEDPEIRTRVPVGARRPGGAVPLRDRAVHGDNLQRRQSRGEVPSHLDAVGSRRPDERRRAWCERYLHADPGSHRGHGLRRLPRVGYGGLVLRLRGDGVQVGRGLRGAPARRVRAGRHVVGKGGVAERRGRHLQLPARQDDGEDAPLRACDRRVRPAGRGHRGVLGVRVRRARRLRGEGVRCKRPDRDPGLRFGTRGQDPDPVQREPRLHLRHRREAQDVEGVLGLLARRYRVQTAGRHGRQEREDRPVRPGSRRRREGGQEAAAQRGRFLRRHRHHSQGGGSLLVLVDGRFRMPSAFGGGAEGAEGETVRTGGEVRRDSRGGHPAQRGLHLGRKIRRHQGHPFFRGPLD